MWKCPLVSKNYSLRWWKMIRSSWKCSDCSITQSSQFIHQISLKPKPNQFGWCWIRWVSVSSGGQAQCPLQEQVCSWPRDQCPKESQSPCTQVYNFAERNHLTIERVPKSLIVIMNRPHDWSYRGLTILQYFSWLCEVSLYQTIHFGLCALTWSYERWINTLSTWCSLQFWVEETNTE